MFKRHLQTPNNEKAMILLTVILMTIILSIVTIGMMGIQVSQVKSSRSVIDTLRAEQLATGTFYREFQLHMEGCPNPPCTTEGDCSSCPTSISNETLGGQTFTLNLETEFDTGPHESDPINVHVNFNY